MKARRVVSILCLLLLSSMTSQSTDVVDLILTSMSSSPKKDLFKAYHYLFSKSYDLNSEQGLQRYKIFKKNLKYVEDINSQNLEVTLGINQFSDITNEEYVKNYLSSIPIELESSHKIDDKDMFDRADEEDEAAVSLTLPKIVDWEKYLPKVVSDQKSCGCCWAFSTVSVIEANYNLAFNSPIGLSEQDLIDCNKDNSGCQGGDLGVAFTYVQKSGLAYRNAIAYTSGYTQEWGNCNSSVTKNLVVEKFERGQTKEKLWEFLAKGPVASYIDATSDLFKNYKKGILSASIMGCRQINHAANIYGYSDNVDGAKVYIVRNSWGHSWGINGSYFFALDNNNSCFLERGATFPTVKRTYNPVPPEPKPKCLEFYPECGLKGTPFEVCSSMSSIPTDKRRIAGFLSNKYEGTVVIPFTQERCQDSSFYKLDHSVACFNDSGLGNYINNVKSILIMTDIKVAQGCIKLFDESCFTGTETQICNDTPKLSAIGWDKKIGSIKLGEGIKGITPFTDENYYGTYSSMPQDSWGLSNTFYKKVRSIKLIK